MTREEFTSLPLKIALGVLYDIAATSRLRDYPKPDVPRPPRFDGRHGKGKDGFVWMSEMAPGDLEWWANKKEASASDGGQYAAQNAKSARTLRAWLTWRDVFPHEPWSGKRGDDMVTARPPSRNPEVHPWPARGTKSQPERNGAAHHAAPEPEEDLNF